MLPELRLCLEHLAALVAGVKLVTVSSLGFVRLERVRVVEHERTHRARPLGFLWFLVGRHMVVVSTAVLAMSG